MAIGVDRVASVLPRPIGVRPVPVKAGAAARAAVAMVRPPIGARPVTGAPVPEAVKDLVADGADLAAVMAHPPTGVRAAIGVVAPAARVAMARPVTGALALEAVTDPLAVMAHPPTGVRAAIGAAAPVDPVAMARPVIGVVPLAVAGADPVAVRVPA